MDRLDAITLAILCNATAARDAAESPGYAKSHMACWPDAADRERVEQETQGGE